MSSICIAGGVTFDSIVSMNEFPDKRGQTVFSSGYHETIGGTGSGKALAASRLFDSTILHYMAGDDRDGEFIKGYLSSNGIKLLTDVDPAGTEKHINLMNAHGERISIYVKYGTFEPVFNHQPIVDACKKSDYIVLNIINYTRYLIPEIKKLNKEIWCDIHDYDLDNPYHNDYIQAADYIFMSSDALDDYRSLMTGFIENGKKLVVCTHAKQGSTLLTKETGFIDLGICDNFKRVDTNGAGDNFMIGFMYAWSKGRSPEICQKYATIAAGLCISSKEIIHTDLSIDLLEDAFLSNTFIK